MEFKQKLEKIPRAYNGLPSVTSILDVLEDPLYIRKWKESAEDPATVELVLANARQRGTYVHLVASDYYKRNELNYDPDSLTKYREQYGLPEFDMKVTKFLNGLNKFIAQEEVIPLSVEEHFAIEELGYAGSPDIIGYFRGKLSVLDWKTSSSSKIDEGSLFRYWLQLAAYASMWNYLHPDQRIEQLVIVPLTAARTSGLGEIEIISDVKIIQSYFFQFLECKDKFFKLWPLSPSYPQVEELIGANKIED